MESYVSANKQAVERAGTLKIVYVGVNSLLQNMSLHANCCLVHTVPQTKLAIFCESEERRKI